MKQRILVVEDEGIVGLDIQSKLVSIGYQVVGIAATSQEAIEMVRMEKPDLILMDIKIRGETDGIETAIILQSEVDTPIIFLTAYSDQAAVDRSHIQNAYGYLLKPFQERDLAVSVELALYKHSVMHAVRESEQWLNMLLKNLREGIIALDDVGLIKYINPSACSILDVSPEQALRKRVSDIMHQNPRKGHRDDRWDVFGKNGRSVPVELKRTTFSIGSEGISGEIIRLRDITEDLRYEESLRQAQQVAEQASRAKSAFLAKMSHELRTPLNSILGMIELSLEKAVDPEQNDYLGIAHKSTYLLLGIINSVLDYIQQDSNENDMDVEFTPVAVLEELKDEYTGMAAEKGIGLNITPAAGILETLRGKKQTILDVLHYVMDNAIKFTDSGEVSLSLRMLRSAEKRVDLSFVVTDTGVGMSAETIPKVLQPFIQADDSPTRSHGGSGLGLSIAERKISAIGGQLLIESELGKGTSVSVIVSLVPVEAPGKKPAQQKTLAPLELILIEDDPQNLSVTTRVLERIGHTVTGISKSLDALELLKERKFDMALVDLNLPVVDGFGVATQLRNSEGINRNIPILALTANVLDSTRVKALACGMNGFLAKPFNSAALESSIAELYEEYNRTRSLL